MQVAVNPRSSGETLLFAAQEAERYLGRMLPAREGCFRLELDAGAGEEDRFSVRVRGMAGRIEGSNPRSVLLGVYDYLRRLGCRFTGPGMETVPAIAPEALEADYSLTAAFRHRGVCIEGADSLENVLEFVDWLPKAGFNSFFLQFKVPYAFFRRWYHHEQNPLREPEPFTEADALPMAALCERETERRGLILHKAGHGWTGELLAGGPVTSWGRAGEPIAPQRAPLAAMVGGERGYFRGIPANTNLCFSHPDAIAAFAGAVADYAQENPRCGAVHVWLADTYNNVCECPACRETTLSDQYVALLNAIDRLLTQRGLDTRIVFLLYQELLWPPVRERLEHPERFILMFAPISRTFARSYPAVTGEGEIPPYRRNEITLPTSLEENLAFLRGWQRGFSGDSFVYDYPLGRAHYGDFGYVHMARVIGGDIDRLGDMGLEGYISCQQLRSAFPNGLPNYVMGRRLLDREADTEALIDEYFAAAYPEDPALAREHLEALSALADTDYLNGKGPRRDGEQAARLERIAEHCRAMEPRLAQYGALGGWWAVLEQHNAVTVLLARAMAALARGEDEQAARLYGQLRRFIFAGEERFQRYLDAYRLMEVTGNYTGFGALTGAVSP